jgi:hypothetical protein
MCARSGGRVCLAEPHCALDSPLDLIAAPQQTIRTPAAAAVMRGHRGEDGGPLEADLKVCSYEVKSSQDRSCRASALPCVDNQVPNRALSSLANPRGCV